MTSERELVFISHANPEDNDVALWLSSRLYQLGYSVWSDVTKLLGGERFWQEIEEAIRDYSVKFVILLSSVSQKKDGVLNELHLAIATGKKNQINDFVIPVRTDGNLSYNDIIGPLIQMNCIDLSKGWGIGLEQLKEKLESDGVPKSHLISACEFSEVLAANVLRGSSSAQDILHIANCISIETLPDNIFLYRIPGNTVVQELEAKGCIAIRNGEHYLTFASESVIRSFTPQWVRALHVQTVDTDVFLHEGNVTHGINQRTAHRIFSYLLRKEWEKYLVNSGLKEYNLANDKKAYYYSNTLPNMTMVKFNTNRGRKGKRNLVGFSKKKRCYWHYAISSLPILSAEKKLLIKSHVVFTNADSSDVLDNSAMHRLRRSFCKNWWNDRWRDMLLAFLTKLSGGEESISIPLYGNQMLVFSANPDCYRLSAKRPTNGSMVSYGETDE